MFMELDYQKRKDLNQYFDFEVLNYQKDFCYHQKSFLQMCLILTIILFVTIVIIEIQIIINFRKYWKNFNLINSIQINYFNSQNYLYFASFITVDFQPNFMFIFAFLK
jgi:hypothetical protein